MALKYKVGDHVRIKSLDWYNKNKDEYGYVKCIDSLFTPEHSKYCGCEFTISHITEFRIPSYVMENNGHEWTDEMIEGLAEEPFLSAPNITEGVYIHEKDMKWTTEYILPDGYIFKDENGNVINATKIVLEKKKKEYPKTYEECNLINGAEDRIPLRIIGMFTQLINARNAYWRIAGKEMGLGKPWSPSDNNKKPIHAITRYDGYIIKDESGGNDEVLEFPTVEMRDAFYENFKELIEQCKELL